jgi:hypothetical protein
MSPDEQEVLAAEAYPKVEAEAHDILNAREKNPDFMVDSRTWERLLRGLLGR